MTTETRFDGQVAVVTGAASGIGRALSTALARRGAIVVLADIDEAGVKAAADELAGDALADARGGRRLPRRPRRRRLRRARRARRSPITGGSTCSSTTPVSAWGATSAELTLAHWNRVIDVNLRGVIHGVAAAYPVMIRQGRGHIVNTASLAGLVPAPCSPPTP